MRRPHFCRGACVWEKTRYIWHAGDKHCKGMGVGVFLWLGVGGRVSRACQLAFRVRGSWTKIRSCGDQTAKRNVFDGDSTFVFTGMAGVGLAVST